MKTKTIKTAKTAKTKKQVKSAAYGTIRIGDTKPVPLKAGKVIKLKKRDQPVTIVRPISVDGESAIIKFMVNRPGDRITFSSKQLRLKCQIKKLRGKGDGSKTWTLVSPQHVETTFHGNPYDAYKRALKWISQ